MTYKTKRELELELELERERNKNNQSNQTRVQQTVVHQSRSADDEILDTTLKVGTGLLLGGLFFGD